MENKKSFGAYICQRRKELGLTQKEFAQRLFVTDSAVSKWERGLAYPDITLLQSICEILEISEKELLTSSEDTEGRRAEQLAKRYLRMARNYRIIQYILYGLPLLGCLIGNLVAQHTLSWFWIVLTADAAAASLTLMPALAPEGRRGLYSLGAFTVSLLALLAVCCLYTGGDWFFVAAVSVLFGMGLLFLWPVLRALPLPEPWRNLCGVLYLAGETALLVLLLAVCCLYTSEDWFFVAAAAVIFGVGLVFGPLVLWKLPWKGRRGLIYAAAELGLLVLLYGASCLYTGGSWFLSAAWWTVFGVSLACLPLLRKQIPLPYCLQNHKALLYLTLETVLLLGGLALEGWERWFPMPGLYWTLLCLALPWGLLGILRYLPIGRWFRAAAVFLWFDLYAWLFPWFGEKIELAQGWTPDRPYDFTIPHNFAVWDDGPMEAGNITILVLLGVLLCALACVVIGIVKKKRK